MTPRQVNARVLKQKLLLKGEESTSAEVSRVLQDRKMAVIKERRLVKADKLVWARKNQTLKETEEVEGIRNGSIKILRLTAGNKHFEVKVDQNWYVNVTDFSKLFGKRAVDWLKSNRETVARVQSENLLPVVITTLGRLGSTTVVFEIFALIAKSYVNHFILQIVSWIKHLYLSGEAQTLSLKKTIASLKGNKSKISLHKGPHVYCFLSNGLIKLGDSLKNDDGSHNRMNSHATSVGRLKYLYVIYMHERNIIILRILLKNKFWREENNREFFLCTSAEAFKFTTLQCSVMGWGFASLSVEGLVRYNNSL